MEKARLSFVKFENNDVIATSGNWVGKNLYTLGSSLSEYYLTEPQVYLDYQWDTGVTLTSEDYYMFSLTHDPITKAKTAYDGVHYPRTPGLGNNTFTMDYDGNETFYLARSAADILNWIRANNIQ